MMKIFVAIIIILMVGALAWGGYKLIRENQQLKIQAENLEKNLKNLQKDNLSLQAQINYFQNPENLLKLLKSQFNYREAGEKLIILVPKK